ncbi:MULTISPECIES: hypothetical protein [Pseudoalteromonas]|uniref:DUF883 domain-containing protein n=1 Tax=Pseudoalteromonas amylolytica TaxID=1859457 RepID=A0A1S1MUQ7_9GAMM|nr:MULTISPECIES: hypothetical protein [Pseudoalteromonas]OHU86787.1 hypothetical protein BFC16_14930 [Pseudoalteromonas sp. JW3]OHU88688.1 hypothetical protein BET10_17825 [Pseudoalteromonas amylolytica]
MATTNTATSNSNRKSNSKDQPTHAQYSDEEHPVSDKMADTLHHTVDGLHSSAAHAEEVLRAKSGESATAIKAQSRLLQQKWNKSGAKKYATENPVKTAGFAFTAGMLLTLFLKKK